MPLVVYLESGAKRTFAGAVEWPGLDRGGRDADAARDALVGASARYKRALGTAARGLVVPAGVDDLEVAERHRGDAGTDFGIPSQGPAADGDPVDAAALRRLTAILRAAWAAFDEAATAAIGVELRKGPRGGGRELERIVEHVREAEDAYLRQIGGKVQRDGSDRPDDGMERIRAAALDALAARARGEPIEAGPRRKAPFWSPRYFVRRSAWHALDHAWEIEDRSQPG